MRLEVLGASGGIGGDCRTTALRVDDDLLLDCGTGVGDLPLSALVAIDHVLLSHAHLDHVALLPMLADVRVGRRTEPLAVYALPETLAAVRECLFNGRLWPDYTSPAMPYVHLRPVAYGCPIELDGRRFTPLPVRHAVPAAAWRLDSGSASLVFSGDTTYSEAFWNELAAIPNLRHLIIETTFLNDNEDGCEASGHTNARRLARGLARLARPVVVHVTHMEPGREADIWAEVLTACAGFAPRRLERGQVITF
ncbi:3',5'-cyclic-nucleotide phosphodiesterase [Thiobacter aerophilum]|uniref:3',5'-cyclic-nucleotide phosphodiesterase n=1 Tax=Thiobacter aerophilum TaxID=3121275 RepID=A0ABV0EJK5_9BURK